MELTLLIVIIVAIIFVYLFRRSKNKSERVPSEDGARSLSADDQYLDDSQYNDNYWFPVEEKQRAVIAHLRLKYTNTSNVTSERNFDVSGFSRGEKGYHIHGFCHKKNRKITLSSIGISDTIDLETGEQISDINKHLEAAYVKTDGYLQDLLFDEFGWAIYSLIYLAASSGSVVKKEREVISNFILAIPKFSSLDPDWIDKELKDLYRPGKMEIRNWVKESISRGKDFSVIDYTVAELEAMQKKDNKEFWTFKRYIEKQSAGANKINA